MKPRRHRPESPPCPSRESSEQAAAHEGAGRGPAHASGTRELQPEASADDDRRALILLVDRDPISRASLARVFLRGGFDVTTADTPAHVLEALQTSRPKTVAVVSLDGLGDVLSALRPLVQARPSLPLLVLTQQPHALAEQELQAAGARRFGVVSQHMPTVAIADGVRQLLRATSSLGE